jgi:hypothetical protein
MKKNLQKYPYILLAAGLLTLTGCGSSIDSPVAEDSQAQLAEEPSDAADSAEDKDAAAEDTAEDNTVENTDTATENDTDVILSVSKPAFSVSYETKTDETTADDGTVLLTTSVTIPTVSGETENAALDKINKDMKQFLESKPTDTEALTWAQENYEAAQADDGMAFIAYSDDTTVQATRLDENVISFEITYYSYYGGAHGNYISVGRNYNAKTGELIIYDELSADPDSFCEKSGEYLADLAETPSYSVMLFSNTSRADVKTALLADDKWIFTESGITYISDPYALAPYAGGTIYFTIPYADAESIGLSADYSYPGNYVQEQSYTSAYDMEGNDITDSAEPEYAFDLNGDGKEEEISFYGSIYGEDGSTMSLLIDGTQFGDVISEQVDLQNGYPDNAYVLYDLNPEDSYVELGVLYFSTTETDLVYQTYFFRYTEFGELTYLGMIDGYAGQPDADFDTFRQAAK